MIKDDDIVITKTIYIPRSGNPYQQAAELMKKANDLTKCIVCNKVRDMEASLYSRDICSDCAARRFRLVLGKGTPADKYWEAKYDHDKRWLKA